MGFRDLLADSAAALIEQTGDACVFVTKDGAEIPTFAVLQKQTPIIGQLGEIADMRPSVALLKSVVGRPAAGTVKFPAETYVLDKLLTSTAEGLNGDDGFVVRYYVRQVPNV